MFEIIVKDSFAAAHNLREYQGKCEKLHGHNYKVEVKTAAEKLNKLGMAVDFTDLKRALKEIVSELDHNYLNDIEYFKKNNPTSELIAKYIFDKLKTSLENAHPQLTLTEVKIWETGSSCAVYKKS